MNKVPVYTVGELKIVCLKLGIEVVGSSKPTKIKSKDAEYGVISEAV